MRSDGLADRILLLGARGARAFAFGFSAVLLGVHLERDGLSPAEIGVTLGIGLAAASLTGLGSALLAGRIGRRGTLSLIGLAMALTGVDLALSRQPALLMLSGLTGMLGAASVDYGPFAAVEQAVLAETATPGGRNRAFGRYSLTGGWRCRRGSRARPRRGCSARSGRSPALPPCSRSTRSAADSWPTPSSPTGCTRGLAPVPSC
ncbi:MAG: hypothetical protein AUI15_14110 [Actinobacteria bacterium 13_2_20CM_2_66_6]|nr:MAG: hypothetical protein AUI15_14110 [Actinobacteria bacterium 13_2_20CM_2_66_6]